MAIRKTRFQKDKAERDQMKDYLNHVIKLAESNYIHAETEGYVKGKEFFARVKEEMRMKLMEMEQ